MRIYSGYACIRRYIYIRIRIESRPARQKKCSQLLYTPLFFGGNPLAGRAEKNAFARSCERNFEVGFPKEMSVPLTLHISPTPYTCFICLSLLKGCLPLCGEGSLWQTTGSNRALVAKKFTYW